MDIKEIQNLIKFVSKSGVEEVKIEREDFKITIKTKKNTPQQIVVEDLPNKINIPTQVTVPVSQEIAQENIPDVDISKNEDSNHVMIKSPIIGTFYRKPSPDKPAFVEVGQNIGEGDVLCVIEAMKLFNEIESEVSGKIVKILVDDQSPVEFDQPLFLIDPS
jgi:acetyl-CoA carboxylase biotin carboxyl carrier protein|tara:strand:- start:2044 stop:2529 length:486 start_codon:yes stop_codon:yes gene_type:complete